MKLLSVLTFDGPRPNDGHFSETDVSDKNKCTTYFRPDMNMLAGNTRMETRIDAVRRSQFRELLSWS